MTENAEDVFFLPKFSNYDVVVLEQGDCIAVKQETAKTYIPTASKTTVYRSTEFIKTNFP